MTYWFSADHHFNHANIIKYTERPFSCVEDMNQAMIERHNSVVKAGDTVFFLGDFMLGNSRQAEKLLKSLNGHIIMVPGCHDSWINTRTPISVVNAVHEIEISDQLFVLCHYPFRTWHKSFHGSINLHGHSHGTTGVLRTAGDNPAPPNDERGWSVDVGVDCWNFYPISFEFVMALTKGQGCDTLRKYKEDVMK